MSAFKLTNRQMLWLTMAHVSTLKHQIDINKKYSEDQLHSENLHLEFKKTQNFREAFDCGEMSEQEKKMLKSYLESKAKAAVFTTKA